MNDEIGRELGRQLLQIARQTIEDKLLHSKLDKKKIEKDLPKTAGKKRGTFVTLTRNGTLRGCIGNIEPVKPLFESIIDNAAYAAFKDTRFSPLSVDELTETKIEISILTPTSMINYEDNKDLLSKIRPGIDGVLIKKGYQSATFLPQVWEQLKDPETFLSHLCMKAGLSSKEWTKGSLDVFVYQVQSFEENDKSSHTHKE